MPNDQALFHQSLTGATDGPRVDPWQINSRDLGLHTGIPWSIRRTTLHGGKQEGVDCITLENGRLRLVVLPTRGLGVLRVEAGDIRLGWDSPVKEPVHPMYVDLASRGGLGWLEGFNEWMVRCGLESCGGPGRDRFITNTGAEAEMELYLHGRIANLPASQVEVVVDREPPHRLHIRGRVFERMFYGPKLELEVDISTAPGAGSFRVDDTVTNRGGAEQEFQLLYHVNFGPPLLESGARFVAPLRRVIPMNAHAAGDVRQYDRYAGPTPGFVEQVYCLEPLADSQGRTLVLLRNAAGDRGATMRYSLEELPCLSLWKSTNVPAEGYVTGIEPGTGYPNTRRVERQFGRVPQLAPGAARRFGIEYTVLEGALAVGQVEREIAGIQRDQLVELLAEPIAP